MHKPACWYILLATMCWFYKSILMVVELNISKSRLLNSCFNTFLIYQCTNQFSIPFGVSKKPWLRKLQYCWIFQFSNQTFCSIIEIFRHRCGNKLLKNWYIVLITWPILSQFLTVITILTISTVVLKILALKIKKS